MEQKFINNALQIMKFNVDDEDKELIDFVNMREYKVASDKKPLLLTLNLQSCIALVAYSQNFSFLAHMNVYEGNCEKDFTFISKKYNIGYCNKVKLLYEEIIKRKDIISEPINIGLVLGIKPVSIFYFTRMILERDLETLITELSKDNINVTRMPDIHSYCFILDSRNGNIIQDGVENDNEIIYTLQNDNKVKKNKIFY